jgi:hypothetical protein
VIGVKVFDEKMKPVQQAAQIIREHHHHHHYDYWPILAPEPITPKKYPWSPYQPYWCSSGDTGGINESGHVYGALSGHDQGPVLTSSIKPDLTNTVRCMNSVASAEFTSDQKLGAPKATLNSVQMPTFDMGTGFGDHKKDKVTEESFERGTELETMLIYYASAQSLREIGIDVDKKVAVTTMPQAFASGFCTAPVTR